MIPLLPAGRTLLRRRLLPLALILAVVSGLARAQLIPGAGTGLAIDANTVALFRFEDSAATALDSTANHRDATATNTTASAGLFGSGRSFNGTGDRLEFNNVFNALSGSSAWTIEYFAKSADGSYAPSFENANPSSGWYFVPQNGAISYGVKTSWDGNSWNAFGSVTAPALDLAWHYYALTFTAYGALSVFRDGVLLGSSGTFGSWAGSNSYGVYLDFSSYWGTYYGAGVVDDIRFSNVARSAVEISNAYSLAAIPEPVTFPMMAGLSAFGLVLWRRWDRRRKARG